MAVDSKIGGPNDGGDRYNDSEDGLLDVLDSHNKNKEALLELFDDVASGKLDVDAADSIMYFRANKTAMTWANIIEQIGMANGADDTFVRSVATIWHGDETEGSKRLNELAPESYMKPLADGSYAGVVALVQGELYEAQCLVDEGEADDVMSQLVEILQQDYVDYLEDDISQFLGSLSDKKYLLESAKAKEESERIVLRSEKLKRLLPKIGAHALDTLKIAVGVAGGITIASFFKRH